MAKKKGLGIETVFAPVLSMNKGLGKGLKLDKMGFNPFGIFGKDSYSADMGGQPAALDYTSVYDPATMAMLPEFEKKMAASEGGFNQFRQEALRKGPSSWANLAKTKLAMDALEEREKGARTVAAGKAEAMNELAMRGGLSSGARERLAESGAKNLLDMTQNVNRQGKSNALNIGIQDEQNRIQQLSALPGVENQRVSAWQNVRSQDLGNLLKENENRNQFNQNKYNQQMSAWAAGKQAEATANSGKK